MITYGPRLTNSILSPSDNSGDQSAGSMGAAVTDSLYSHTSVAVPIGVDCEVSLGRGSGTSSFECAAAAGAGSSFCKNQTYT